MTSYRNKYLEMLKAENSGKAPTQRTLKTFKTSFEGFEGNQRCRWRPLRCLPELSPGGVLALSQVPPGPQSPRLGVLVLLPSARG
jgi:hypothetical protein